MGEASWRCSEWLTGKKELFWFSRCWVADADGCTQSTEESCLPGKAATCWIRDLRFEMLFLVMYNLSWVMSDGRSSKQSCVCLFYLWHKRFFCVCTSAPSEFLCWSHVDNKGNQADHYHQVVVVRLPNASGGSANRIKSELYWVVVWVQHDYRGWNYSLLPQS